MYRLFRFAAIVIPRMPHWLVHFLSRVAGLLVWLVAKKSRDAATRNMIHVLGPQVLATRAGRRRLRRTVQKMLQNNVRNYTEVFTLPSLRPETIRDSMQIDNLEDLDAALALGKGVILFSAHLGPFDYMMQLATVLGYKVTIPVEPLKDQRMLDLMLNLRRSRGVEYVPLNGSSTMRTIISALRRNQIVLITADRAIQGESVEKPFFGSMAHLPIGPVILSQRTGAALVGAFGWRAPGERPPMHGQIVPISLALPEEERKNTDVLMERVVETLEQFIKAHPEQWMVFTPLWVDQQVPDALETPALNAT